MVISSISNDPFSIPSFFNTQNLPSLFCILSWLAAINKREKTEFINGGGDVGGREDATNKRMYKGNRMRSGNKR